VAPLTTAVMGSVDAHHAGVASGINNAVSRTAGLLAVAALGVVLAARFDEALDRALDSMAASPDVRSVIDAQRAKLAAVDLAALDPTLRSTLRHALDSAYDAGFRALMITCAGLAFAGALISAALIEPPRKHHLPPPSP